MEDDAKKAGEILSVLKACPGLSDQEIVVVPDVISARKALARANFDLMILDILLPKRFGESPTKDAGLRLLKDLENSTTYQLPFHVIGLTAHPDVLQEANQVLGRQLWTVLLFEFGSTAWAHRLQELVRYLTEARVRFRERSPDYDYDVCVACALPDPELSALRRIPLNWRRAKFGDDATNYYTGELTRPDGKRLRIAAAAAAEMGLTAAATLATKLIYRFSPRYLANIGIAAGVRDRAQIGDLLIADITWNYQSGKLVVEKGKRKFVPEPLQQRLSPGLKSKFELLSQDTAVMLKMRDAWAGEYPNESIPRCLIGPIASGSAVVADDGISKEIAEHQRKLLGVEMECYSIYFAAANAPGPKPLPFCIKGVSDYADEEKDDKYRKYASYLSANTLIEFLRIL